MIHENLCHFKYIIINNCIDFEIGRLEYILPPECTILLVFKKNSVVLTTHTYKNLTTGQAKFLLVPFNSD